MMCTWRRHRDLSARTQFADNSPLLGVDVDFTSLARWQPTRRWGLLEVGIVFPEGVEVAAEHPGYSQNDQVQTIVGGGAILTTTTGPTALTQSQVIPTHDIPRALDDQNTQVGITIDDGTGQEQDHGIFVVARQAPRLRLDWLLPPEFAGVITITPQSWTLANSPAVRPYAYARIRPVLRTDLDEAARQEHAERTYGSC